MKKIGILLSDCGFPDGSESQEAALTLLASASHPFITAKLPGCEHIDLKHIDLTRE